MGQNMGNCGACYAFATTGAIESSRFLVDGQLIKLSDQQILDCDMYDQGCHGGSIWNSTQYVMEAGGLMREEDYPYEGSTSRGCRADRRKFVTRLAARILVFPQTEAVLKQMVFEQPVAANIDASDPAFETYTGGMYRGRCNNDINSLTHSVLVVGYGALPAGEEYWLLKNCYGPHWGVDGYMYLPRNQNNRCGIATNAY